MLNFKIVYSIHYESIFSLNVPIKCTYNTCYNNHFTLTCFGITMSTNGVHTKLKTIYSQMGYIYEIWLLKKK